MRTAFTAGSDDHGRRLESVLRKLLPHQGLGALHKALRQGDIRLNGAKAASDTRVSEGDVISVWDVLVQADSLQTEKRNAKAEALPIPDEWVLFEGPDLLVINKPSGLLVHRGDGPNQHEAPLDDRVRTWLAPSTQPSLSFRPGPLHRLDRETSGIVVFSKTLEGARTFSEALASRKISKTYLAVLKGALPGPQEVTSSLTRDPQSRTSRTSADGEEARTVFRPIAWAQGLTLTEVDLGTGRTHQIRVHAQSLGFPLAGDTKYGGNPTPPGLDVPWLLHAWKLSCALFPTVKAPLPGNRSAWVEKTFKIPV